MSTVEEGRPQPTEREEAIKHRVLERTGGRMAAREVELIDDRVIVRGTNSAVSTIIGRLSGLGRWLSPRVVAASRATDRLSPPSTP